MKILFINTLYNPYIKGGAEITLESLARGLKNRGHDVFVLSTGPSRGIKVDFVNGIQILRVGFENIYWHFRDDRAGTWQRAFWHLRDSYNSPMGKIVERVIQEINPDVVCCHNLAGISVAAWSAIKKNSIPLVQVLHDFYNICPNSNMLKKGEACSSQCRLCKLFRIPHHDLSKNVDAVIGVSHYVLEKHLQSGLFLKSKVKRAIHNARNLAEKPTRGLALSSSLTFGFIGTLSKAKGVELLINAFNASDKISDAKLLIAGSGPEPYQTILKRHQSSSIRFLGYVKQEDFFPLIDILIIPSIWQEPLGMVVVEAFSYGIPVVGSRRGGIPEMIKDKVNGFLFDPDNPKELQLIMEKIYFNPNSIEAMKPAALASFSEFNDINSWCKKYENVFYTLKNN